MSKINNLTEFLAWRGCGDDPYSWARAFYKYTDCGPWTNFLCKGGGSVYYEDLRKPESQPVNERTCSGIQIGSIVEGSDQCAGPYDHVFPFDTEDFEKSCADMERVTSFYWKRDNASWYRVETEKDGWTVADVCGDLEWEGDPPEDIKAAAEKAIENDWQDDPRFSGCIVQTIPKHVAWWEREKQDPDWKPLDLGVGGATIHTFTNDDNLEDQ